MSVLVLAPAGSRRGAALAAGSSFCLLIRNESRKPAITFISNSRVKENEGERCEPLKHSDSFRSPFRI